MALLQFVADFDGCQFALTDVKGTSVMKQWRLLTDLIAHSCGLHGRKCDKGHRHAECRGKVGVQCERYTEEFAKEVAQPVTTAQPEESWEEQAVLQPLEETAEETNPTVPTLDPEF